MKKSKILFVPSQTPDYLEDIVFHGLVKLLGRQNVVDYPLKRAYHYNEGMTLTYDKQIKFTQTADPKLAPFLLFDDRDGQNNFNLDVDYDDFDGVVIGSLRYDVIKTVYEVLSKFPKETVVFLDGEDDPFIRLIYFKNIRTYFKREKLINDKRGYGYLVSYIERQAIRMVRYFNDFARHPIQLPILPTFALKNVKPLPYGIIDIEFELEKEKAYDFCFIAGFSRFSKYRVDVYNFLLDYAKKNKLNAFIAGRGLSWHEYMKIVSQSKISISVRGEGSDTYRYWEIPYAGSMLLSDLPVIEIPNNFVETESAVFFTNIKELKDKLDFYLKNDECLEIAKNGRKHLLKYHTSVQRAETVLKELNYLNNK